MNEAEKWKKRFERERMARFEAERLLEEKSLALYLKSEELDRLVQSQKKTIKEKTKAYEAASADVKLLSDAVSNTDDAVIITGPDNRVMWANKAVEKISGYSPEEFIGNTPGELLQGKKSDPKVRNYMRGKIKAREPFETEILNYRKDRKPYWVRLQATPVFDDNSVFKYFVAIQSDITEKIKINKKLAMETKRASKLAKKAEEANLAKTKFLALMSHELRTPLNGIIGYAQILGKNTEISSRDKNKINVIKRSGEYLLSLINDILDISRIESGEYHLSLSKFELEGMLNSALEIIQSESSEKNITLKRQYIRGSFIPKSVKPYIFTDSRALRQILLNLLSNSIKLTDSGYVTLGYEIIDLDNKEATLRFSVCDSGKGISKNSINQLSEVFTQVDADRDMFHGAGLGLYISQQLVTKMGGKIEVESSCKAGNCLSFCIKCPFEYSENETSHDNSDLEKNRGKLPSSYTGKPRKILIVDDIKDNRDLLTDLLEPIGFALETSEDGYDALQKIRKNEYDMVLSDVIMPYMNGYELIRMVRSDPNIKSIPIVAVSASLMQLTPSEKENMKHFDGFISKPVMLQQLLDMVRHHLNLNWVYKENHDTPKTDRNASLSESDKSPVSWQIAQASKLNSMMDISIHDLNNQIMNIGAYTFTLESEFSENTTPKEWQEYLTIIENSKSEIEKIVEALVLQKRLLSIQRIQPTQTQLQDSIDNIVERYSILEGVKPMQLKADLKNLKVFTQTNIFETAILILLRNLQVLNSSNDFEVFISGKKNKDSVELEITTETRELSKDEMVNFLNPVRDGKRFRVQGTNILMICFQEIIRLLSIDSALSYDDSKSKVTLHLKPSCNQLS